MKRIEGRINEPKEYVEFQHDKHGGRRNYIRFVAQQVELNKNEWNVYRVGRFITTLNNSILTKKQAVGLAEYYAKLTWGE